MKLIIDDGTREIPITNQFGQTICTIRFRPGDIAILDRFKAMQAGVQELFKPLLDIDINRDGTADTDAEWKVIKGVENELIAQLNTLLDIDNADDIFRTRHPFSRVGGEFFATNFINAIGKLIADTINEENDTTNKKLSKYMPEANDAGAAADNADC